MHKPPHRIPVVDEITGAGIDPTDGTAFFQFTAGGDLYELRFPLDQAFILEEYYIKIRQQLGLRYRRRKPIGL